MVLTKEYRIVLPFTVNEYKRGILYMVAKASTSETASGVPMQIVENGPFENEMGKGLFTHRILYLSEKLPEWARKLLVKGGNSVQVEEKSWNAYPYIKTSNSFLISQITLQVYTCSLFGADKFEIVVESRHADDAGNTENIHNLTPGQLKKRVVDFIDIATDKIEDKVYKKEEDPQYFKSKKTGRGPFKKGWQSSTKPIMCAYKLVTVNFNYFGLRHKIEKVIHEVIRNIYLNIHRQSVCWLDEWIDLSHEKLRSYEDKVKESLNKLSAHKREEKKSENKLKAKL